MPQTGAMCDALYYEFKDLVLAFVGDAGLRARYPALASTAVQSLRDADRIWGGLRTVAPDRCYDQLQPVYDTVADDIRAVLHRTRAAADGADEFPWTPSYGAKFSPFTASGVYINTGVNVMTGMRGMRGGLGNMGALDFSQLINAVLPSAGQAATNAVLNTPQVQQDIADVKEAVIDYAAIQIILQAITAGAIVYGTYMTYQKLHGKGSKK